MSKLAGDLTLAIRGLCEVTKGAITHSEARIRLKEMGFEVVLNPGRMSPELAKWNKRKVNYDRPKSIQKAAKACGFDNPTRDAVLKERNDKAAFDTEANNFNVTKNIWKKNKASGKATPSRKPVAAAKKNARAKEAKENSRTATTAKKNSRVATTAKKNQPVPAHPRGKNKSKNRQQQRKVVAAPVVLQTGAEMEALSFVERNGGMAAVEQSLTVARSTVSELEQVIEVVAALTKRISAAA